MVEVRHLKMLKMDFKISQSPARVKVLEDHQVIGLPSKIKRSFDVAFLLSQPEEKFLQKEKAQGSESPELDVDKFPLTELSVRTDLVNCFNQKNNKLLNNNKVFISSECSVFQNSIEEHKSRSIHITSFDKSDDGDVPKSAFSKVAQIANIDSPIALSPDRMSCSSSSPPSSYSPPISSTSFCPDYTHFINSSVAFQAINQGFSSRSRYKPLMCGNGPSNNRNISNNNIGEHHIHGFGSSNTAAAFMTQPEHFIRNGQVAFLSSLLPTTLGALSSPSQNVCAKCNISFRMTSDLVYHMRSHHKNENVQDPNRRKREEKLKCPVCSESFRERHHLSRHVRFILSF